MLRALEPNLTATRGAPGGREHEARWQRACFLAIDVETTGLSPTGDRVIEVAWVRFEGGRPAREHSSLCRVDVPIPPVIHELTHITPAVLAQAPAFVEVAPGLLDALERVDFAVAYNATFDVGFLRAELRRCGHSLPAVRFLDPLAWSRRLTPSASGHRLVDVCARHGVTLDGAHRALADARAAGELALRLGATLNVRPPGRRACRARGDRAP